MLKIIRGEKEKKLKYWVVVSGLMWEILLLKYV